MYFSMNCLDISCTFSYLGYPNESVSICGIKIHMTTNKSLNKDGSYHIRNIIEVYHQLGLRIRSLLEGKRNSIIQL